MSTSQIITPFSTELLTDPKQLAAHLQSQRASSGAEEFEASLFGSVLEKWRRISPSKTSRTTMPDMIPGEQSASAPSPRPSPSVTSSESPA